MNVRLTLGSALAVVALLIAVPLASAGFDLQYEGQVENDSSTFVGFNVQKVNGKTKITNLAAGLAYVCRGQQGGGGLGYGNAKRSLTVKNGKFKGTVPIKFGGRGAPTGGTYTVSGSVPKNGLAKGTISSELKFSGARGGSSGGCYTGGLDWKVTQNQAR